jgi:DNA-3-methyladenine glycosylase II
MRRLESQNDLDAAIENLLERDPRLRPIRRLTGPPALRRREAGFPGLVAIIVGQQLSTASAAAIWGRLSEAFRPFDHRAVRRSRAERLRRLGLSDAKVKTLRALTREIETGRLDFDALADGDADDARRALTLIHGIGPWTADLYLLFCLGHADAWPAGDLALQEAMRMLLEHPARPDRRGMESLAEAWRPLRGAAAHLLWAYYRAAKGRSGAI